MRTRTCGTRFTARSRRTWTTARRAGAGFLGPIRLSRKPYSKLRNARTDRSHHSDIQPLNEAVKLPSNYVVLSSWFSTRPGRKRKSVARRSIVRNAESVGADPAGLLASKYDGCALQSGTLSRQLCSRQFGEKMINFAKLLSLERWKRA